MGTWGGGSFENDTALDYAADIDSIEDIERALGLLGAKDVEIDAACAAIVAAECVAAMRGHPDKGMPADLAKRVRSFALPSMELLERARDNVSLIMEGCELTELWAEAEPHDRAGFNRAMTDLVERLSKPAKKTGKSPAKKKVAFNHSPCSFCGEPMGEVEASMFDITVSADEIGGMKMGGWAHIRCLNAALHPSHLIQNWELDDELLEFVMDRIAARDG